MISAVIYSVACIWNPILAYLVINEEWEFHVPLVDIDYKPWRLLIVVTGLPGLLSAVALLFFPESPKFVLNQGDAKRALEIVQRINRWNNGKSSKLGFDAIKEDSNSSTNRGHDEGLLATIWIQTAPLFKPPYLRSTVLICVIMMLVNATAIG